MSPLNEAKSNIRERWPLAFDLEGVPQDTATRNKLLQNSEESMNNVPLVQNTFAVDYAAGNNVIDINNPPKVRYVHQEYPKLVYHYESGHVLTVHDEKQLKLALKKDYQLKPSPERDYSKISRAGIAPVKTASAPPPLTDEQLLAAEEEA